MLCVLTIASHQILQFACMLLVPNGCTLAAIIRVQVMTLHLLQQAALLKFPAAVSVRDLTESDNCDTLSKIQYCLFSDSIVYIIQLNATVWRLMFLKLSNGISIFLDFDKHFGATSDYESKNQNQSELVVTICNLQLIAAECNHEI